MHAEIVILTGENVVLNADDGAGIAGSNVSVADDALGADGMLAPGESFSQVYELVSAVGDLFSFFLVIIGRDP